MATIWLIQPMNIQDGTSAAFKKVQNTQMIKRQGYFYVKCSYVENPFFLPHLSD